MPSSEPSTSSFANLASLIQATKRERNSSLRFCRRETMDNRNGSASAGAERELFGSPYLENGRPLLDVVHKRILVANLRVDLERGDDTSLERALGSSDERDEVRRVQEGDSLDGGEGRDGEVDAELRHVGVAASKDQASVSACLKINRRDKRRKVT